MLSGSRWPLQSAAGRKLEIWSCYVASKRPYRYSERKTRGKGQIAVLAHLHSLLRYFACSRGLQENC